MELMSISEAARILKVSRFTLYYWTSTRKIPHYRIGRRVMIARADLEAWIKARKIDAA